MRVRHSVDRVSARPFERRPSEAGAHAPSDDRGRDQQLRDPRTKQSHENLNGFTVPVQVDVLLPVHATRPATILEAGRGASTIVAASGNGMDRDAMGPARAIRGSRELRFPVRPQ
jgi:hypothetical protein